MISAKLILRTQKNTSWSIITTMELTYPRFIHSEFMTHRAFSRNASSSRAIPVPRMIEMVRENPAMPSYWGKNQPGMQAREELNDADKDAARAWWQYSQQQAVSTAEKLHALGAHKQIVNRILEPFSHITVVCTATDWKNFFNQRNHADAQPEMQELARVMIDACEAQGWGDGRTITSDSHYPYTTDNERRIYNHSILQKISVARCARVSYLKHDGTAPTLEDDELLYNKLISSNPPHWSPFEHVAYAGAEWSTPYANFHGWQSLRHRKESKQ